MPNQTHQQSNQRLHAIIRGRVQGVSYRYYAALEAERLGLVGWVRNNPDGSVETIVEGKNSDLRDFIDFLHLGSPHATVSEVQATWQEPDGKLKRFQIRQS